MVETPFSGVDGEFVRMPPRNVVPKPVQKPHPPVWVACSRRDTIHLAAQNGIGALAFAFIDPDDARRRPPHTPQAAQSGSGARAFAFTPPEAPRHWMADYHETLATECVPIGD